MDENPYKSPLAESQVQRSRSVNRLPLQWPSYFFALLIIGGMMLAVVIPTLMDWLSQLSSP